MNKKITELLGKELAEEVAEKLGDVKLGITNDGSLVPSEKYETLKEEHKALQSKYKTEIEALNSKLDEAVKASGDAESLKQVIAELKTEQQKTVDEYNDKMTQLSIDSAIEVALVKANAKNNTAVKALLDMDAVKLVDGQLFGFNEQIEKLKANEGYLFAELVKKGKEPQKGITPPAGKKAQLIEAYNKATSVPEQLSIMAQIKALGNE
jgi:hypothetical protein